jgi:hypothetical protein
MNFQIFLITHSEAWKIFQDFVEVYLHITLHFHHVFSQPRINRGSHPRTVSCRIPCYFSHNRWKNCLESSDIADWEDARMALKLPVGKIIVSMASGNIWESWLFRCAGICLVGPFGLAYCSCAVLSRWVMSWRLGSEVACTSLENC